MTLNLLTTAQVAELLHFDASTILRWHKQGKIPGGFRAPSGALRFRTDVIEQWVIDGGQPHDLEDAA